MKARRSWLFVPGDSARKLEKSDGSSADVLIFDLEDSVAPQAKEMARSMVAAHLSARPPHVRERELWVRVNPLDSGLLQADLAAIAGAAPDGIMLPKAGGPDDVRRLGALLGKLEQKEGLKEGATMIAPLVGETPRAALAIPQYAEAELGRVAALAWGAEDLSAAIGASGTRDAEGQWHEAFRHVRVQTLLAAHALGVQAVETLHADFSDEDGLIASSRKARSEGFSGRLAIHPAQVAPINAAFTPSDDELDHARAVVDAFGASPGAGVVSMDGKMLDRPHLEQAKRTLALAGPGE